MVVQEHRCSVNVLTAARMYFMMSMNRRQEELQDSLCRWMVCSDFQVGLRANLSHPGHEQRLDLRCTWSWCPVQAGLEAGTQREAWCKVTSVRLLERMVGRDVICIRNTQDGLGDSLSL